MFKFLFIVFLVFILFVFIFGFSIVRLLFKGLFGTRPKQTQQAHNRGRKKQTQQSKPTQPTPKKIIDSDEGEYVDYEEIKD